MLIKGERVKKALKAKFDGLIVIDELGAIETLNSAALEIFRYDLAEVRGRNIELLLPGLYLAKELDRGRRPFEGAYEAKANRQDGTTIPVELTLSESQSGRGNFFIILVRDSSDRITKRAALEYQVVYDALTGLANRILFYDRLQQHILTSKRLGNSFALFIIDLNDFRKVNEQYGHYAGDCILQQVATRLSGMLRESDTVARLGGDEFAVLLPTAENSEDANRVANKLFNTLEEPFELEGHSIEQSASLGVAIYPEHGADAQALIQHADLAMGTYGEWREGKSLSPAYPIDMKQHNLGLKSQLHQAMEKGQLLLHYQPKIEMKSGRMVGVEALVRWQHPDHDLLGPDMFIHLAEQSGFIRPLGLWVARTALAQCAQWRVNGYPLNVSINLSMSNLQDEDLPDQILDVINSCSAKPEWLELEITESAVMTDPQRVLKVLDQLNGFGIRLSIDDFGTGYSSLTHLKQLPVDEIKIDKSFVLNMSEDNEDSVIVHAAIDLAHNLGLQVVAEGVVSYKIWCQLSALGCDTAQGYYISRPLTAEQLTRWLEETGPRVDWSHF